MKLSRTKEYNFGWLVLLGLVDIAFLLIFFLLLSSNFILQPGISVSMPFSRFALGPQINQQIISITGDAAWAIAGRDQTRRQIHYHQSRPADPLRNSYRGDKRCAGTRNHVRRVGGGSAAMNIPASETAAEALLFSWEPPRRRQLALAAFMALSLTAHALCFYVFQIVYPPTVSLLPPPARVGVITSSSEEGRTLLRWLDAEDPALAFTTQRPPEERLRAFPKVEHVPSYLAVEPALKEIPPQVTNLGIPDSQPPGAAPFGHRQPQPAIGPTTTSVLFSKELEAFGDPTLA